MYHFKTSNIVCSKNWNVLFFPIEELGTFWVWFSDSFLGASMPSCLSSTGLKQLRTASQL